jgi:hypothetical protein
LGCCAVWSGRSKHLWNVGKLLPDFTVQQFSRQPSSEPEMFRNRVFSLCDKQMNGTRLWDVVKKREINEKHVAATHPKPCTIPC